jgi:glycosyltransferase involved in cell wall biosynthesis
MFDKEIIVISNGCIDGTKEYLDSKPVKSLYFDSPLGYPKAVNEGIEQFK